MLGVDPEFFIVNPAGEAVPASRFFPHKEHKIAVGNGHLYRDGYALEINVAPAIISSTIICDVYQLIREAQYMLPVGYRLSSIPAMKIDPGILEEVPADLLTFGCEPSLCAYAGDEKRPDVDAKTHPWRYVGGHIHFSWTLPTLYEDEDIKYPPPINTFDNSRLFIKMMDLFVGVPLTYILDRPETFRRRDVYGQAGEFRIQQYGETKTVRTRKNYQLIDTEGHNAFGLEYRTPTPEMWNHPLLADFALRTMKYVWECFERLAESWDSSLESAIREAVNTGRDIKHLIRSTDLYSKEGLQKAANDHSIKIPGLIRANPLGELRSDYWR